MTPISTTPADGSSGSQDKMESPDILRPFFTNALLQNSLSHECKSAAADQFHETNLKQIKKLLLRKNKVALLKACKRYGITNHATYQSTKESMCDAIINEYREYFASGTGKVAKYAEQNHSSIEEMMVSLEEDIEHDTEDFEETANEVKEQEMAATPDVDDLADENAYYADFDIDKMKYDTLHADELAIVLDPDAVSHATASTNHSVEIELHSITTTQNANQQTEEQRCTVGSRVWVQSTASDKWRECMVIAERKAESRIRVHYMSYSDLYNEWIRLPSKRVSFDRPHKGNKLCVGDNFSVYVTELKGRKEHGWLEAEIVATNPNTQEICFRIVSDHGVDNKMWKPLQDVAKFISLRHRKYDDPPPSKMEDCKYTLGYL
eukprot:CAMPEP_0202694910 /NCGR_PEP_ID=MMETSP1385-20130828/8642_1 /ASSEMBLY_ACC=CAM_ASM_000861 /TAXON_ID=933848 /ORGANISM="Elphidium margaritaceum" /LENGTH=378 /DNA_ID=CAMNT_0049350845 /DNA_START=148 /DNA_END=1284 /DNA_ORIENTATION=+